jgi:hypothetical protein
MIERVTNVRYPKDVVHEPLRHLRDRAKRPPKGRKYVDSSSAAPRHDDLPLHILLLGLPVGTVAP